MRIIFNQFFFRLNCSGGLSPPTISNLLSAGAHPLEAARCRACASRSAATVAQPCSAWILLGLKAEREDVRFEDSRDGCLFVGISLSRSFCFSLIFTAVACE